MKKSSKKIYHKSKRKVAHKTSHKKKPVLKSILQKKSNHKGSPLQPLNIKKAEKDKPIQNIIDEEIEEEEKAKKEDEKITEIKPIEDKEEIEKKKDIFKDDEDEEDIIKKDDEKKDISVKKDDYSFKTDKKYDLGHSVNRKKMYMTALYIVVGIVVVLIIGYLVMSLLSGSDDKEDDSSISNIYTSELIKEDIKYGDRSFIFAKKSDAEKVPVIIVLHGGKQDSNVWFEDNAQGRFVDEALEKGYAIISPDSIEPLCPDVKQWDYTENSTDFELFDYIFNWIWFREDLDADNVYVTGISIGGFMSSRLANHYGRNIKAIAIHSGGNADHVFVSPSNKCYIEYNFNNNKISPDHARTLIIHGTNDTIIPYEVAIAYYNALKEAGTGVKLIPKENAGHTWFEDYNKYIFDWFE